MLDDMNPDENVDIDGEVPDGEIPEEEGKDWY